MEITITLKDAPVKPAGGDVASLQETIDGLKDTIRMLQNQRLTESMRSGSKKAERMEAVRLIDVKIRALTSAIHRLLECE